MAAILGMERSDKLIGKQVMDFYHPDCHEAARQRVKKLLEVDYLPPAELILIRSDGSIVNVEVTGADLIYQGQTRDQVVVRDITDRKLAEEALRKSEERLELALKGHDLGMWDYNFRGLPRKPWSRFRQSGSRRVSRFRWSASLRGATHWKLTIVNLQLSICNVALL